MLVLLLVCCAGVVAGVVAGVLLLVLCWCCVTGVVTGVVLVLLVVRCINAATLQCQAYCMQCAQTYCKTNKPAHSMCMHPPCTCARGCAVDCVWLS